MAWQIPLVAGIAAIVFVIGHEAFRRSNQARRIRRAYTPRDDGEPLGTRFIATSRKNQEPATLREWQ